MSSESTLDYETMTQDAMRGVVRRVLEQIVNEGLPGDHHFYISFDTLVPGVILSKRLREKYEEEMTIVLQHRFWDLAVGENYFEVKLTFDGIPERLVVPFQAIKVFFDPSVRYGLQFDVRGGGKTDTLSPVMFERGDIEPPVPALIDQKPRDLSAPVDGPAKPTIIENPSHDTPQDDAHIDAIHELVAESDNTVSSTQQNAMESDVVQDDGGAQSAKIVSLDEFRKK